MRKWALPGTSSGPRGDARNEKATLAVAFSFLMFPRYSNLSGFDNTRSFKPDLVLDESREDWSQRDSQSTLGVHINQGVTPQA